MDYLDENPIDEVYRIRERLMSKYGSVKNYHKYLRESRPQLEKAGARFLTESEFQELKSRNLP